MGGAGCDLKRTIHHIKHSHFRQSTRQLKSDPISMGTCCLVCLLHRPQPRPDQTSTALHSAPPADLPLSQLKETHTYQQGRPTTCACSCFCILIAATTSYVMIGVKSWKNPDCEAHFFTSISRDSDTSWSFTALYAAAAEGGRMSTQHRPSVSYGTLRQAATSQSRR